jgi:hypothetical protein
MNRWDLMALFRRLTGGPVPGDQGNKYKSQGYLIPEMGPKIAEGKGMEEYEQTRSKLMSQNRAGCPFRI